MAVFFGAATPLLAQRVTVQVVRDAEHPLPGAFVRLLDESGTQRAAGLTGVDGRLTFTAPRTERFRLRAEMPGYQSATSPELELTAGDTIEHRIQLAAKAVLLDGLKITAEGRRCVVRPREGQQAHQLWEEAQKALSVAEWAEKEKLFQFALDLYTRDLDPSLAQVEREELRSRTVRGNPPFIGLTAEQLASGGFVQTTEKGTLYYAPDARILLSDAFLDGHCFRVRPGDAKRAGWIGLGFSPVRGSKLPDVEGVLWLDQKTAELRQLEYRYRNLPRKHNVSAAQIGGRVEFEKLASGAWIVRRWWIRMPKIGLVDGYEPKLLGIREQGGAVGRIVDAGGTQIARSGAAVLEGAEGQALGAKARPSAKAVTLAPVVVTAERRSKHLEGHGFYQRQAAGFGRFLTREEIERRGAPKASDLLVGLPGVTMAGEAGVNEPIMTSSRISLQRGVCYPSVLIDGRVIRAGGSGSRSSGEVPRLNQMIRPSEIEALEVYPHRAGLPVQAAGLISPCGAILIWTRR